MSAIGRPRLSNVLSRGADVAIGMGALAVLWLTIVPKSEAPVTRRSQSKVAYLTASVAPGSSFRLDGVDWRNARRHLIVAVSSTCPYCKADAGLYRALAELAAADAELQMIVVGNEKQDALRRWLKDNGITARKVISLPSPQTLGIRSTPTLLIVDARGVITDVLQAKASPSDVERILQRFRGDANAEPLVRRFDPPDGNVKLMTSQMAAHSAGTTVVDVGSRQEYAFEHEQAAVSIPLDELRTRAPIEFPLSGLVVVDCKRVNTSTCLRARDVLLEGGFTVGLLVVAESEGAAGGRVGK
jgi:glutaredoxin/rhodanese-related sulfurtransferase